MAEQGQPITSSVFLRPASGLVKAAGLWDVFIYNVGLISLGIGIAYTQRFGSAYYSGASIVTATILAAALMMLVALGFWTWTVTIPRSGGIYVFLTRARFPAFGFALSFVECVSWLFYVAIAAKLIITVGLIPLLALVFGPTSSVVQWLSTSLGQLIVASAVIWLAAALLVSGTHTYLKLQRVMFVIAIVGTLALLIVIGMGNSSLIFRTNFNEIYSNLGGEPYSQVLSQARSLGWTETTTATFGKSVALLVWPFLPLIGSAFSIGIGGEIRNTTRNQLLGMLGSLLFCAVGFVVVAILGNNAIGTNFQGAIAFNFDNAGSEAIPATTPFEPYFSYLAGLATNSTILRVLIPLGFLCWVWFWIPGVLAYTERAFLAWALDRAAPAPLAALHSRFATPYVAVVTGALIAQIFLVLILFTNFFATLVFILAAAVAWCIALILGAIFPSVAPNIFGTSPIAKTKFFGINIMSVFCAIGAFALGFDAYLLWNDPLAAGHSAKSLIAIGITFAAGFIFHVVMKQYRKHQGIDISRAYKEIPVE